MAPKHPQAPGKAIDIKQVAALAKVSPATVSRVTNGSSSVNAIMAARVWKAIEQLGYRPNPQARALVSGRSRTLGLLISEITNPFYAELVQSFQDVAADHDYEVLAGSTNHQPQRAPLLIKRMLQHRVEGVAVITFRDEEELLRPLMEEGVPLVTMDTPVHSANAAALTVDYRFGLEAAVQHLAALGHSSFCFVSGPLEHATNAERRNAFLESVGRLGIKPPKEWLLEGDHTLGAGTVAVNALLQLKHLPTAIVCSNDMTAIGVLRCLQQHAIKVPRQMSVVGFDDIHLSAFVTPSLTTVRMSPKEIALAAFYALRNLSKETPDSVNQHIPLRCALVVRESTARVPSRRLKDVSA